MSCGFFRIGVYKKDGSPDEAKAKEVFDWLKANCKWFIDGNDEVFDLRGNKLLTHGAPFSDGLDVDESAEDPFNGMYVPGNLDFLDKASVETKAETIVAVYQYDGYDNSYLEKVWIDGVEKDSYSLDGFNNYDERYTDSCRRRRGVFKNTKTGEEVLAGELELLHDGEAIDEEYDGYFDDLEWVLRFYGTDVDDVRPKDKDACVKAFVAYLKEEFGEDAQISESDWTFVGLGTERTFFDLYGTNPPLKQYREASEVVAEMNKK